MGKKKKGPKGAASYAARLEEKGLSTVMADAKKSVKARTKRTSGKVKSAVTEARSY
jgi:hypothetical protein